MCGDGRPCQMGCDDPGEMSWWLFITLVVGMIAAGVAVCWLVP